MERMRSIFRGASVALATVVALLVVALPQTGGVSLGSEASDESSDAKACSKQVAKQTLRKFIRAYNRGDSERLDRLFTEEPEFLWYSAGPPGTRLGGAADRRSDLLRYFKVRHRRHDRLHLRYFGPIFKDHGIPFFKSSTHFSLYMSRRANGFNHGRWFRMGGSKGALVCEDGRAKIFIMSLGGRDRLAGR